MLFKEPINISIDIDGVLVNNFQVWKEYFNRNSIEHKHVPQLINCNDSPCWDYFHDICKKCWNHVLHDQGIVLGYQLVDEAFDVLGFLKQIGFKLHIISSRPDDVVEYTKQWAFDKFGLLIDSVTVTNDKVASAKELECRYHIDDAPEQIQNFQKDGSIQSIIWDHPYNKELEGPRVESWPQYAAYLLWSLVK